MKARYLKKLLNNTGYTVAFYDEYFGIGSPLCHDLIKVEIPSYNMTYALGYPKKNRAALDNKEELAFIWDKLEELIKSGEMDKIITENDELENPLPAYTVKRGVFISTYTDAYGWPNVTIDGHLMYDNTYFDNPIDALKYGIKEMGYAEQNAKERLEELNEKREEIINRISRYQSTLSGLKLLLTENNNHERTSNRK